MVAAGPGVDHCEAAVQQKRLLSRTLKQSQGATAQGVAGNNQARTPARCAPKVTRLAIRMNAVHCKQLIG